MPHVINFWLNKFAIYNPICHLQCQYDVDLYPRRSYTRILNLAYAHVADARAVLSTWIAASDAVQAQLQRSMRERQSRKASQNTLHAEL